MTVIVFLKNGSKMIFANSTLKEVVKQLANTGVKINIWRLQFHADRFQNELTELAKDIEVTDFEVLNGKPVQSQGGTLLPPC